MDYDDDDDNDDDHDDDEKDDDDDDNEEEAMSFVCALMRCDATAEALRESPRDEEAATEAFEEEEEEEEEDDDDDDEEEEEGFDLLDAAEGGLAFDATGAGRRCAEGGSS